MPLHAVQLPIPGTGREPEIPLRLRLREAADHELHVLEAIGAAGDIVGSFSFYAEPGCWIHAELVRVRPRFRQLGVGRRLLVAGRRAIVRRFPCTQGIEADILSKASLATVVSAWGKPTRIYTVMEPLTIEEAHALLPEKANTRGGSQEPVKPAGEYVTALWRRRAWGW